MDQPVECESCAGYREPTHFRAGATVTRRWSRVSAAAPACNSPVRRARPTLTICFRRPRPTPAQPAELRAWTEPKVKGVCRHTGMGGVRQYISADNHGGGGIPAVRQEPMAHGARRLPGMPAAVVPIQIREPTIKTAGGGWRRQTEEQAGFGGDSWNTNLSLGGEGRALPSPQRLTSISLGGGRRCAGSRETTQIVIIRLVAVRRAVDGIVFIRAFSFTGTATITANGANAYNGTANDAGGVVGAARAERSSCWRRAAGEGGLTLQAKGGTGGNALGDTSL